MPDKSTLEEWIFERLMDRTRAAWEVAPILGEVLACCETCPICQDDDQDV